MTGQACPDDLDGRVFERFLDIGGGSPVAPSASGLAIARALSDATEGAIAYKRDPNWTHFSFRLPLESPDQGSHNDRMSLSAGVG